ncbi:MAG: CBS domain-containing protein [Xanthomonadales bacterium]|nr:CBS domain-containing protein [Xanthomonadales bacterium]
MPTVNWFLDQKGRNVFSVRQDAPVLKALELMAEKDCGALVVLDDQDQIAGVISERDYARKIILERKASIDTPISEIMTAKVVTVREEHSLDACLRIMGQHNIRHLPVVRGRKVVGVLGIGELVTQKMIVKENEIRDLKTYINGAFAYR